MRRTPSPFYKTRQMLHGRTGGGKRFMPGKCFAMGGFFRPLRSGRVGGKKTDLPGDAALSRLAVGIRGSAALTRGAVAALFIEAFQEVFEFGSLFGTEHLTDLVAPLLANVHQLRINLLPDGVEAMLRIGQNVPDLFLLIRREIELGGEPGHGSRRIGPRLQSPFCARP